MPNEILNQNIQYLKGVGEQRAHLLAKLGVDTVGALLHCFPRGYIDYRNPLPLGSAPPDQSCAVRVTIIEKKPPARISGGRTLAHVTAEDSTGLLEISFFNNPYTPKQLEIGESYILYGRFTGGFYKKNSVNPIIVTAEYSGSLFPIYPATERKASRSIARLQKQALAAVSGRLVDPLPSNILEKYRLCPLEQALADIHFPPSAEAAANARARFAFEQVLSLSLGYSLLKQKNRIDSACRFACCDPSSFIASLPFEPTSAQKRSITEICSDLGGRFPMNRLLQGDVGSGKTAVAAAGVYCAFKSGFQSAFMAPSEILAGQHAETLHRMLSPFGVKVGLLTSAVKGSARTQLLQELKTGGLDLLVGTHALLSDGVVFNRLGYVVTDEQHRFGVEQRTRLTQKGDHPHTLFLSATPIPRSLALVIYGELDLSTIDELPSGRKPIKTVLVNSSYRERYLEFIRKNALSGGGSYIVCPLVDDSEVMTELESAEGYCAMLKKRLPELHVSLIHGKLKSAEKAAVIKSFANGSTDVLVSTTVVEVGVDISHATIMVIENADRYGLSELHQLRGRVGRGSSESYCVLVTDSKSRPALERLRFLVANSDGFKIAQYDLSVRGPGDFFGLRQHGLPELQLADTLDSENTLSDAASAAAELLKDDPALSKPEHALISESVSKLFDGAGIFH